MQSIAKMAEYGFFRLATFPTTIGQACPICGSHGTKVHESCYRAAQTLRVVRELLKDGTPGAVVLALLEEVDHLPTIEGASDA